MNKLLIIPNSFEKIETLPDNWEEKDYAQIIDKLGLSDDGMKGQELIDFAYMAIADEELHESAKIILKYVFGDKLTDGQIDNLSHQFEDDKMWEEYPDINMHRGIFKTNQLLYKAYNGKVPHGVACKLNLSIESKSHKLLELVLAQNMDLILKIVMAGTDEHSLLNRLYGETAVDEIIDDASGLLWNVHCSQKSDTKIELEVISSLYWFEDFVAKEPFNMEIDLEIYEPDED